MEVRKKDLEARRDKLLRAARHRARASTCARRAIAEAAAPRVPDVQESRAARSSRSAPDPVAAGRVAVDAMGGDRVPEAVVAVALDGGQARVTRSCRPSNSTGGLELIEASDDRAGREAADAIRCKPTPRSSSACRPSATTAPTQRFTGNTGRARAGCALRRLPGVLRPAIAFRPHRAALPPARLRASGAARTTSQFAYMGAVFAEEILDLPNPDVRLLSIGEEPEKGNQLTLEAHALLVESEVNFQGNTESRELLAGAADVVVCDGFTGNVALKLLEGTIKTLLDALREEITATARGKLGGLLIRPAAQRLRTRLDPDTYGGAYLLGLRGLAVIAHGNSSPARSRTHELAARGVEHASSAGSHLVCRAPTSAAV